MTNWQIEWTGESSAAQEYLIDVLVYQKNIELPDKLRGQVATIAQKNDVDLLLEKVSPGAIDAACK